MAGLETPEAQAPHLELLDVAKHFGGVQALAGVSLAVRRGSVHALVGENGAGKSTLGKIVAGVHAADGGRVLLEGEEVSFRSPREALERGVAAIAQEPSVVPRLTVAENVFLGAEPTGAGFIRGRALRRAYRTLAASAGFELPGGMSAGRLRTSEQQEVEILRALSRDARLLVMDEPTAALGSHEVRQLYGVIRRLAAGGKTIILISHFLREVLELADSVTVLRDGHVVRTGPTAAETEATLVEAMLGRPLTSTFPQRRPPAAGAPPVLRVRDLTAPGVDSVSFDLRAGEILGLAGLVGAGRTELARAVYGAARRAAGEVALDGPAASRRPSPRRSILSGITMIPESRKDDGLIFGRSTIENATLSRLDQLTTLGFVRRRRERLAATEVLERCGVRGARYTAPVGQLSGGNQQKVLLARTLLCAPRVVIADEPTRGVDVGAKRAIYDFLASLAAEGLGVLLISSELEEVIGLSHRVLVMRRGRITGELEGDAITESAILGAAFGEREPAEAGSAP